MDTMDLVSAVITTHNRLTLLKRAIDSVKHQTYKNIELIVVNDNSTDGTTDFLNSLEDVKQIHIPKEESKGGNYARNIGIRNAHGAYIAFLDDDDIWLPEKIEKQMLLMKSNSCLGMVYCGNYTEDDLGKRIKSPIDVNYEGDLHDLCFQKIFCTTSMMMVKTDVLLRAGMFDETLKYWQEYDLCIRLSEITKIGFVKEPLMVLRVSQNDKNRLTNKYEGWWNTVSIIETKYSERINQLSNPIKENHKLLILREKAIRCDKAGLNQEKRSALFEIWKITKQPKHFLKWLLNYPYYKGTRHI